MKYDNFNFGRNHSFPLYLTYDSLFMIFFLLNKTETEKFDYVCFGQRTSDFTF